MEHDGELLQLSDHCISKRAFDSSVDAGKCNRCQIVRSRVLHNKEQCNHHIQQDDLQRACIRIRRRIDDVARCNRNDPDRRALQDQEKSCFYQLLLLAFIKTAQDFYRMVFVRGIGLQIILKPFQPRF